VGFRQARRHARKLLDVSRLNRLAGGRRSAWMRASDPFMSGIAHTVAGKKGSEIEVSIELQKTRFQGI